VGAKPAHWSYQAMSRLEVAGCSAMAHRNLETQGNKMKNVAQQIFYSPIWPKSTPVCLDDAAEEICQKMTKSVGRLP
jgi:hypothetical protein